LGGAGSRAEPRANRIILDERNEFLTIVAPLKVDHCGRERCTGFVSL
jgi:hypothetical protein